jgi:AraC-like DNA-binding protein
MGIFVTDKFVDAHKQVSQHSRWHRLPLQKIEDLRDAVYGAGLEATQMSRGAMSGSLIFSERDGVAFSSGLIEGKVALSGCLSNDRVTLGLGVQLSPGSRQWCREVVTGNIGLFMPGDEHDALYCPGSLYLAATLSLENIESRAAQLDLVLNKKILLGSGIHSRSINSSQLASVYQRFSAIHKGISSGGAAHDIALGIELLDLMIGHCARSPKAVLKRHYREAHQRIVKLARDYIVEHLHEPISVDVLAVAINTSRRTLFRAFQAVIGESPITYIRTLRLHRIRHDLASIHEARCTIAMAANKWGIDELGRMAGRYRDLFGELPSETRAEKSYIGFMAESEFR